MSNHTDIKHLAKLANLPLSETEIKAFEPEIDNILQYVDEIQKLDLTNVEPTNQVTGKHNEWREDVVTPSLTQDQALSGAKATHKGYFVSERTVHYE